MTNDRQLGTNMEELHKIFQQLVELSAEAICSVKILNDIKESDDKNAIVKQLNKLKELDEKRERLIANLLVEMVCIISSHDEQIKSFNETLDYINEGINTSINTSKRTLKMVEELRDKR